MTDLLIGQAYCTSLEQLRGYFAEGIDYSSEVVLDLLDYGRLGVIATFLREQGEEGLAQAVESIDEAVGDAAYFNLLGRAIMGGENVKAGEDGLPVTFAASGRQSSQEPEETFTVNGVAFTMVRVEAGTFTMGATAEQGDDADDDEEPAHEVTLTKDYYIGQTEVTQGLWKAVMGSNPSQFEKGDSYPVQTVSWEDCQEFIKKLNEKLSDELTGRRFRLPTEAEWEYAARGGNKSQWYMYSGSNRIDDVAWYKVNCCDKGPSSPDYGTHPVGTKQANELGIYDMSGNVWEWCQDWYGDYSSSAQANPMGPDSGTCRVYRGGSWGLVAWGCRVSGRFFITPGRTVHYLGFRLVLSE